MIKRTGRLSGMQIPYVRADLYKCKAYWRCVEACPGQIIGKVGFLWQNILLSKIPVTVQGVKNV